MLVRFLETLDREKTMSSVTRQYLDPESVLKLTAGITLFFAGDGFVGNYIVGDPVLRVSGIAAAFFAAPPLAAGMLTALAAGCFSHLHENERAILIVYGSLLFLSTAGVFATVYVWKFIEPEVLFGLGLASTFVLLLVTILANVLPKKGYQAINA